MDTSTVAPLNRTWPSDSHDVQPSRAGPQLGRAVQDALCWRLRWEYQKLKQEPLPDHLVRLVAQLRDGGRQDDEHE